MAPVATDPQQLQRDRDIAAAEYVGVYARTVVAGEVVANRYVRLACERHLRDLEDGEARGLRWDAEAAGHGINFFSHLRLAEGQFEGQPFHLIPPEGEEWPAWRLWQAFIVGSVDGWKLLDEDGVWIRRFRNAYVETAKGSGKSPLAAGIGLEGLVSDDEPAAEVYSAARVRDQAAILWTDAKRMTEKSPALRRRVEVLVNALVAGDRSFKPVSSEAGNLHGKRVHKGLIDEEHALDDPEPVNAMRAGTKSRRNALIFRITNSGFNRQTICWADHEYSTRVLEGVLVDDAWFAFVCGLDPCDEHRAGGAPVDECDACDRWTDEAVWQKANPNLGVIPTRRYLRELVTEATGKPSVQSIVKRLNFCIWTEGSGKWLDVAAFKAGQTTTGRTELPPGREAFGGLDIASTIDIAAFTFEAPRRSCSIDGHDGRCYDLRMLAWLPEENLEGRVKRDHVPYDVWTQDGWITLTPGNRIDQERIVADIVALKVRIKGIGIDRWNSAWLTPKLQDEGFSVVEVGQGFQSLSAPAKRLEADVAGGYVHHDGNPVLAWMVANAAANQDAAGNVKPDREKSSEKIDGVVAWCDALFAEANHEAEDDGPSAYDTYRSLTE